MQGLIKKARSSLTRGPFHKPALQIQAADQRLRYACASRSLRRQPELFCIGNFKTGTVSLTSLLSQNLTARMNRTPIFFSRMYLKKLKGELSPEAWQTFLIRRSNALALDFEASGFLTTEAPLLAELFPETKFVLTIREPEGWLRSMLRDIEKNRKILGCYYWKPVFAHWFGTGPFPPEEKSLEVRNLYPLQGLLNYWRQSNATAIASIPIERLLGLETKKLSESLGQLENFLELENGSLDTQKSHLHRSSIAENPLQEVPDGYIKELSELTCGKGVSKHCR